MANYTDLKAAIQQVIRENGNEEITGNLLQQSLLAIVNSLGAGYLCMGIATPEVNPGTPDQNVFYIALTAGSYTDFGGIVIAEGETAILRWDSTWHKDTIEVDAQADWDQNDPAADDYIKHRTHYVEPTTTTINDAKLAWSGSTPENLDFWLHGTDIHIPRTSGGWGLTWQGGGLFIDEVPLGFELGVFDGVEWSTNSFDPSYDPQPYPLNVDVVIASETVHKLDNKFLDMDTEPTTGSGKPVTSGGVKAALDNIPAQEQSDWNEDDTSSPAYIKNKPTIPTQKQSDWDEDDTSDPAYIKNKPTIPTVPIDVLKYTEQTLTDAQKVQSRTNIGAASDSDVSQLRSDVDDLELAKSYTIEGGTSPNLFDKTTMLDGFISANYGSIGSNDGSKISDYIPVIPGHYYLISGRTLTGVYSMRCLDANKSSSWLTPLVASTGVAHNKFALPSEDGSTNVANGQFKVPSTAYYVQITIIYDATNGSPDAVMLTDLGDTYSANPPTPEYQPYGTDFKIKRSALPESLETDLSEIQAETDSIKSHFEDVVSPNLFNKDDAFVKSGYYATGGTWYPNVTHYYVSHPIFLEAGVTYKAVYPSGLGATNTCIAIVDKDNNYLNSHLTGTISDGFITVTPSSDCYASFNCGYNGADTLMVCKQSEYPASYTPYYKYTVLVGVSVPSTSKLVGKSVIFTGDSICQATTDNGSGGGWAKRIGDKNNMIWQNKGINGGTITDKNVTGSSFTISDTDFGTGADYIILEGGTNDADRIGSIIAGTTPTDYGSFNETGYSDAFTNDTFCGAVEYLLKRVVSSFPSARVGFIIAPKMGVSNDYTKEGNNRRAYFETIIKLCKKWGVPILNLWDECTMNPKLSSHYTSGQDYLYVDGQHPTGNGYDLISPIIEAWMETL